MYSANLFTFRFFSRLPHLLFFCGFSCNLQFAKHLVSWGFVFVNNKCIKNVIYQVPVMSSVQVIIPKFLKKICFFLLFPYHRISVAPFFETNWNLFTVRILRIPYYQEVILPEAFFDHAFLYEQLAPIIK